MGRPSGDWFARLHQARAAVVWVVAILMLATTAAAQSTSASISGLLRDPQQGVIGGAAITATHLETGASRQTTSDAVGRFRFTDLAPGPYELTVDVPGFNRVVANLTLVMGQETSAELPMTLAPLAVPPVTVTADSAPIDVSSTTLGRRITAREISELPIPGRNFLSLATMTPGILNSLNTGASGSGFSAAGQTGRNNELLIDGLALNDAQSASPRGYLPLDAIEEFTVTSNAPTAEYGQASGAIVSVRSKSGTNTFAGLASVYYRDARLDATPGAAVLAKLPEPPMRQTIVAGNAGAPIVHNRAFFFGAIEQTNIHTSFIVTSPLAPILDPGDPLSFPQITRTTQALGRSDLNLPRSNHLTIRYRLDRTNLTGRMGVEDQKTGTWQRAHDSLRRDSDVALIHGVSFGSALNELRVQAAERHITWDPTNYCAHCPALEYQAGLKMGKNPGVPNRRVEDRWQIADTLTIVRPQWLGSHVFKAGTDVSGVGTDFDQLSNQDGTFTFPAKPTEPYDVLTPPTKFTQTVGNSFVHLDDTEAALFVQDEWQPHARVTVNLGARWQHQSAPGVSNDRNNVAPRIGLAFSPGRRGTLSLRGSYGLYYDQVVLSIARNAVQAQGTFDGIEIKNPSYPDPYVGGGVPAGSLPTSTQLAPYMDTPRTEQATLGFQRAFGSSLSLAMDGVWARGRNLLVSRDVNYPDLSQPLRPRPLEGWGTITEVETSGNSWYQALQVGLYSRAPVRYSYGIAYTLSLSDRDTEDSNFVPQDQSDYAADRGPSLNDARHRLVVSGDVRLPWAVTIATVVAAHSATPYNIITGSDTNQDGNPTTDRPPGVSRNSKRGTAFLEADLRLSKAFPLGSRQLDLVAEVFNISNRRNFTYAASYADGSPIFGKPTGAEIPRELQLGLRVRF